MGQLATVHVVWRVLEIELPLLALHGIIAIEIASNALGWLCYRSWRKQQAWPRVARFGDRILGSFLVLDMLLLTALLYVTGGPSNPFGVFFLVNLALGAAILRTTWVRLLSALVLAAYAFLLMDHRPLEPLSGGVVEAQEMFRWGMLVALSTAAGIIVYFGSRRTGEIAQLEQELSVVRQRREQSERLEALATLAGGAAHELSSPLSTIAVVAKELQIQLEQGDPEEDAVEEARLIRREVTRCRTILDRMAADAGERVGEQLVTVALEELFLDVLEELPGEAPVQLTLPASLRSLRLYLPRRAVAHAIRDLVSNAIDAVAGTHETVHLTAERLTGELVVVVRDCGPGMPADVLARVGHPFFTTKEPGQGMGLGLFLARAVVERLGGSLQLESAPGVGTTARIHLPWTSQERDPS